MHTTIMAPPAVLTFVLYCMYSDNQHWVVLFLIHFKIFSVSTAVELLSFSPSLQHCSYSRFLRLHSTTVTPLLSLSTALQLLPFSPSPQHYSYSPSLRLHSTAVTPLSPSLQHYSHSSSLRLYSTTVTPLLSVSTALQSLLFSQTL